MITFNAFTTLVIFSILAPIAGAVSLLFMLAFEREINFLKSENTKVRLEKDLQQSEYMQLNQQIQPHFLFNSMNLLLGLARLKKMPELIEVLEHLSIFLRFKYRVKEQLIPLSMELEHTEHYLGIQTIRFGERLKVTMDIRNEDVKRGLIPPYMLQTLVENAFKHGLEKKMGEAHVTVILSLADDNNIVLTVKDNGVGIQNGHEKLSDGHGLTNVRRRLGYLFGSGASIALSNNPDGGAMVVASWPFKTELQQVIK
ncbi:sensor histidine kinase [Pseudalkalibacillus caeni]|uniref:Sensor histidine kinase n=1 Tax=Exobacillus caeni TaxID=2574798 RepID=A0A5R9F550_9BACL|nr:histidine kinase [Pseudalkalibacillus caeni]TLS38647.1 sensor histidine kinase [Pseudalkalibacillus caeni]